LTSSYQKEVIHNIYPDRKTAKLKLPSFDKRKALEVEAPDKVYASDMTHIWTNGGILPRYKKKGFQA